MQRFSYLGKHGEKMDQNTLQINNLVLYIILMAKSCKLRQKSFVLDVQKGMNATQDRKVIQGIFV